MTIQYKVKNFNGNDLPVTLEKNLDSIINHLLGDSMLRKLRTNRGYKLSLYKEMTNPHERNVAKGEIDITFNCKKGDKK